MIKTAAHVTVLVGVQMTVLLLHETFISFFSFIATSTSEIAVTRNFKNVMYGACKSLLTPAYTFSDIYASNPRCLAIARFPSTSCMPKFGQR